ncbi:MAG: SusC/RagA family TonB-linked outer membrane protein [Chitinophagaceae bacterium]
MIFKRLLKAIVLPVLLLVLGTAVNAQDKVVTGKVTDSKTGTGLPGVTITVKGTKTAVQTNVEGVYTIKVPAGATTLLVSSTGFALQEMNVSGATANVILVESTSNLNEVVVVGYGTQRKRDLTGAVTSVGSKDFVKGAIQSPEQLIRGKVAGVQITSNGGAPGSGSTIRIRGGASLNASNDPLIVIDGVPVDGGVSGSSNPLNMINPNDIENFTILKDPSAAAIYGSRASNGVILITTKKGSRGKVKYNFSSQFFGQTVPGTVNVLNADQIKTIVGTKGVGASDMAKIGTANTNWQDEIYKTALGQDLNLSASGTVMNGKLPFRVSGGFLNQDGILKTGNFKRQTLGINLSPKFLKDKLKVDFNLKGARTTNRFADEGAIGSAISFDPTQPVRVSSPRFGGFFTYIGTGQLGGPPTDLSPANPVSLLEMTNNKSEVLRSIGNLQLDYTLPWIKGLHANLNVGYDVQKGSGTTVTSDSAPSTYRRRNIVNNAVVNAGGVNNEYEQSRQNLLGDFYLNYANDIAAINSRVDFTAGTGYQDFLIKTKNFPDRRYDKSVISTPVFASSEGEYTLISYYGRLIYTLAKKYVLTGTVRTDGSSKFAKDNRWGVFPSAAFAWRINEEDFLRSSKVVNDLKLRVGYGVTGQQDGIDYYGYLSRYTASNNQANYQFGNTFYGLYRPTAYDPNLKWETTTNVNAAVDFGILNNRISGSVDVFYRKTKDLLSVVPVALGTNFSNQLLTNVGRIESKGVEVTLNATPFKSKKFQWDIGFNFTYVNPEITKLLLNEDPTFKGVPVGGISGGTGNTIQIHTVGYSPNSFFVRKQIYDAAGKPIEGLYEDLNRDGIINENDLYRYKSPNAPVFIGFNSSFIIGKWNAGFVSRINLGNYNYSNFNSSNGVQRQILNPLGWLGNASTDYLNTGFVNNQYFSDYYVQNASFLKMDNINIGYDAGEVFKGARVRITANVQNVFTITNYKGLDPEVGGGIDNRIYPRPRIIALGVNVDF